jgi:hypothetical protein
MAITLQDPTRPWETTSRHAFPRIDAEPTSGAPLTIAQELLSAFRVSGTGTEASFEVESPGGYARSVTGTVVYIDEEAQTLMVRATDGHMMRVPLRDVTSAEGEALSAYEEMRSGLGVDDRGSPVGKRSRSVARHLFV